MPGSARELLRLTPLVRRHRPDLQPPPGDGSDYRRELFDAVTGLLRSVGQVRPVVCVLEDLHWAGTPTLQLLGHTTRHSARSRLLLLCTYRTTAPDRSDELTYAIADLYRLDGVRRIDLPGLSADEVAQYLVAEGGLPVRRAREYATVLRDQTGGNPFFLREMWRDIIARGGPAQVRSSAPLAPASIRDTLQRRLSRLALHEREVLETAIWRPGLPGADACALLSRALDDMPADPDDPGYVRALASLGRAMAFAGDGRAGAVGEQALEYARRLGTNGSLLTPCRPCCGTPSRRTPSMTSLAWRPSSLRWPVRARTGKRSE
jgi:hypothetical protein